MIDEIPAQTGVETLCADVIRLIHESRLDLSDEKRLQADLATVLAKNDLAFEREKRLSAWDIPDFLVGGTVAVECKLRGARKIEVFQQLRRYAEHDEVRALVLVSNVAMGLPPEINGKPVYAARLSRGWL